MASVHRTQAMIGGRVDYADQPSLAKRSKRGRKLMGGAVPPVQPDPKPKAKQNVRQRKKT